MELRQRRKYAYFNRSDTLQNPNYLYANDKGRNALNPLGNKPTTHGFYIMKNRRLDPSQLYKPCNIEQLKFDSTEELDDIDITIGQERRTY